jgi:hypothetical protein
MDSKIKALYLTILTWLVISAIITIPIGVLFLIEHYPLIAISIGFIGISIFLYITHLNIINSKY